MKRLFVLILLFTSLSVTSADKTSLKLAVYLPQSPPYMFIDLNTGEVTGILPDLMKMYSQHAGITFSYQYLNRVRAEKALYQGKADVSLLSPSWVKYPEKLIFSEPLYQTSDKFYATRPVDKAIEFNGQTICTREFFKYPVFDQLVADNKVVRMDTDSEVSQMRMLLSGRCDFAYLNEWVANYMAKHDFSFTKFYPAKNQFDQSNGILAFHPDWQQTLPSFNEFVRQIKRSGELDKIIARYTK